MTNKIRKAVFPVAGLGTRFLPATKAMPKEMLPVVDKPLIQYAVEEAHEAGIEEFIFVTGRSKTAIEDHFDRSYELEKILEENKKHEALRSIKEWVPEPGQISYIRQQRALGLGHAVWCARNNVGNEAFAVILADDLILSKPGGLKEMVETYRFAVGNIVAVQNIPREQTNSYGILSVLKEKGNLVEASGLVEKPNPKDAPSTLSIIGRYILQPEVFLELEKKERGSNDEIQLTDAISNTIGKIPFHGLKISGTRYDCGNNLGYIEANIAYALERANMKTAVLDIIKKYS